MFVQVPNHEGYYISPWGDVLSIRHRWNDRPHIIKPILQNNGYYGVTVSNGKNRKRLNIHRILSEIFIYNEERKPCVNHKNGIKTDNRLENLEWVTHSENNYHAYRTGLHRPKEPKISLDEVKNIRRLYASRNKTMPEMPKEYGVNCSTISRIVNFKRRTFQNSI